MLNKFLLLYKPPLSLGASPVLLLHGPPRSATRVSLESGKQPSDSGKKKKKNFFSSQKSDREREVTLEMILSAEKGCVPLKKERAASRTKRR